MCGVRYSSSPQSLVGMRAADSVDSFAVRDAAASPNTAATAACTVARFDADEAITASGCASGRGGAVFDPSEAAVCGAEPEPLELVEAAADVISSSPGMGRSGMGSPKAVAAAAAADADEPAASPSVSSEILVKASTAISGASPFCGVK